MQMTVTNTSSTITLNDLDTLTGGVGPSALLAVGGQRINQLPYPFNDMTIAPSGSLAKSVHINDFLAKRVPWDSFTPGEGWNAVIQSGMVTVSLGAETGDFGDFGDSLIDEI